MSKTTVSLRLLVVVEAGEHRTRSALGFVGVRRVTSGKAQEQGQKQSHAYSHHCHCCSRRGRREHTHTQAQVGLFSGGSDTPSPSRSQPLAHTYASHCPINALTLATSLSRLSTTQCLHHLFWKRVHVYAVSGWGSSWYCGKSCR